VGKNRREREAALKRRKQVSKAFIAGVVSLVTLVVLVLSFWTGEGVQPASQPTSEQTSSSVTQTYHVPDTREEVIQLVRGLLEDIKPWLPRNSYMPDFMKEKISLAWQQTQAGTLQLMFEETLPQGVMMKADYDEEDDSIRHIHISLPQLKSMAVRFSNNYPLLKNVFAISFAHEMVHLEKDAEYLRKSSSTKKSKVREEVRAWHKTIVSMIRPLRGGQWPMYDAYKLMDEGLKKCNDAPDCAWLIEFIEFKHRGLFTDVK